MVGQRMVIGFPGTEIDEELKALISKYKIGNIILFRRNITSLPQVKKLCEDLQILIKEQTGYGAFITIDQEGGMVTRLSQDCVNMPGAMAISATEDASFAYQAGFLTAGQLRDIGINFNLAPTVDINSNIDNPVIGVRSFGDRPEQVAEFAISMTKGLLDGGVLACAKHFPGHGDTNVDSHIGLPLVDKSLEDLEQCELYPFRRVIEAGIPAVMTTHILFPKLEEEKVPATMSRKIITGILREKMGFEGLIVSDCMEMNAIKNYYGTAKGVIHAVKAGVDLVFISHTASDAREVAEALIEALEKKEISREDMETSVERIIYFKKSITLAKTLNLEYDVAFGKKYASMLIKKSLTPVQMPSDTLPELGSSPLFIGAPLDRSTIASNLETEGIQFSKFLAERFGGEAIQISTNPMDEEILTALENADSYSSIVLGTYNGHLNPGQLKLIGETSKKHDRVIVFALRNPYDLMELPNKVYGVAVYEYTGNSLEAIAQLLEGKFKAEGRLPVRLQE